VWLDERAEKSEASLTRVQLVLAKPPPLPCPHPRTSSPWDNDRRGVRHGAPHARGAQREKLPGSAGQVPHDGHLSSCS
jgi:hypothetical protein